MQEVGDNYSKGLIAVAVRSGLMKPLWQKSLMSSSRPSMHGLLRCHRRLVPGGACGSNPILTRLLQGVGHAERQERQAV